MSAPKAMQTHIFIGMLVGVLLGVLARLTIGGTPDLAWIVSNVTTPIGQIFLRMIFMVVVPLIVSALVLGVAEIGDVGRVGRIGLRTLVLTLLFSGLAVLIGITAVNVVKPGVGLSPQQQAALRTGQDTPEAKQRADQARQAKPVMQVLTELVPRNPLQEAVNAFEGGLIPLMVFALIMGLALSSVDDTRAGPLKDLMESIFAVMLKIIDFAMKVAPFGVAALMFNVTATLGLEAIVMLGKYAVLVLAALALQQIVVYGAAVRLIAGRNPWQYFAQLREVMLTAFSTSSSNATLPTALRTATDKLQLPRDISQFVLTVGATANQNGTALFEGVTVLFLAQLYGVDLTYGQQATVVFMSILAGVGTAGVPGGSLPLIAIVLQSIGVPGEGVGIILGIDRILDMSRTVLNVTGDLTIATCVAAWEGPRPIEEENLDRAL